MAGRPTRVARKRPSLDEFMDEHGLTDMDGFLGKRPMTSAEMTVARQGMIAEFFEATSTGRVERVELLLRTGYREAMLRATTPNGATAAFIACEMVRACPALPCPAATLVRLPLRSRGLRGPGRAARRWWSCWRAKASTCREASPSAQPRSTPPAKTVTWTWCACWHATRSST